MRPLRRLLPAVSLALALLAGSVAPARAIVVDGRLDPSYTLVSSQTTQTNPGPDPASGQPDFADGSELDAAYAAVDGGVLYLFFAGNLKDTVCASGTCTDFGVLEVFIDSQAGGQNPLVGAPNAGTLAGLTFDSAFVPDFLVNFEAVGALNHSFVRYAEYITLPSGGGGTATALGIGTNSGAPGTLAGGTNPWGFQATIDNGNVGGVGAGCGGASGAGVTTGVELAIPLAAIGNPTGCINVSALVFEPQGAGVTNQVLGPLPPGTCAPGAAAGVSFASVAGDQFFTVCLGSVPTRRSTWGAIKSVYR